MVMPNVEAPHNTNVGIRLFRTFRWHHLLRWRSALADLGLIAILVFTNIALHGIQVLIFDGLDISVSQRLTAAGTEVLVWAALLLPTVFIVGLALLVAPAQGVMRWLCALAAAALDVLWGNRYAVNLLGAHPSVDHVAQGVATGILWVMCCFFQNTSRGAESKLMRRRIDRVSLDAEFNRAQLDLLRAQIEPHFLFNTLATVVSLAKVDRAAAADMLDNLIRYFEAALPKLQQRETTLADEMQLIEAYLLIQQTRMGARLRFDISLPENLRHIRVPSVILLTLVENAIKHGVAPLAEGGLVQVRAQCNGQLLTLEVSDSGRGMQREQGHGSGLANVRARLALLYGQRSTLNLSHGEPHGVIASIEIPQVVA